MAFRSRLEKNTNVYDKLQTHPIFPVLNTGNAATFEPLESVYGAKGAMLVNENFGLLTKFTSYVSEIYNRRKYGQ